MQEKVIYTPQEVQRILGITYNAVKKLADEGVFDSFWLQKRLFIKKESFDAWLFDTGGKDPIIDQEKAAMWEPEPETGTKTDQEQEIKEDKTTMGTEAIAETESAEKDTPKKVDMKPAENRKEENSSTETGEIQSWCYSVAEAAKLLGISPTTMYTVIKKNNIHYVSVGTRILLPKRNFHKWLEKALSEPGRDLIR